MLEIEYLSQWETLEQRSVDKEMKRFVYLVELKLISNHLRSRHDHTYCASRK